MATYFGVEGGEKGKGLIEIDDSRYLKSYSSMRKIDLKENPKLNELLSVAADQLFDAALNLLQADPHQWSTRPCQTCRAISAIAKRPFGCELYRKQQAK